MQLDFIVIIFTAAALILLLLLLLLNQIPVLETFTSPYYWSYVGAYNDKDFKGKRVIGCTTVQSESGSSIPKCQPLNQSQPAIATPFEAMSALNQGHPNYSVLGIQGGYTLADTSLKSAMSLGINPACTNPLGCKLVNQVYRRVNPIQKLSSGTSNGTAYIYLGPYFNNKAQNLISNPTQKSIVVNCPSATTENDCMNEAALIASANNALVFGFTLYTKYENGNAGFKGDLSWSNDLFSALRYGMAGLSQSSTWYASAVKAKVPLFVNQVYASLLPQVVNRDPTTYSYNYYGTYNDSIFSGKAAFPIKYRSAGTPTTLDLTTVQTLANAYGAPVFGIGLSDDAKYLVIYFATYLADACRLGVTTNTGYQAASVPLTTANATVNLKSVQKNAVLVYAATPETYFATPTGYKYLGAFVDSPNKSMKSVFSHEYTLVNNVTISNPDSTNTFNPLTTPYTVGTSDAATIAKYLNASVFGIQGSKLYLGTSLAEATQFGAANPLVTSYSASVTGSFQVYYASAIQ